MRLSPLVAFILAPLLLVACTSYGHYPPVTLTVPSDSRIFHGEWTGRASGENVQLPITLRATATYRSSTTYDIAGTMEFRGVTYVLRGEGRGRDGATFRPQFSPGPPTGSAIQWSADVLQDTVVVAKFSSERMGVRGPEDPELTSTFALLDFGGGQYWGVSLQRVPNASQP